MNIMRMLVGGIALGLAASVGAQGPPVPPSDAAWRAWLEYRAAVARQTPSVDGRFDRGPHGAAGDAAWMGYSSSVTSGDTPALPAPPQLYRYGPYVPYGGVVPSYGPLYVYPY